MHLTSASGYSIAAQAAPACAQDSHPTDPDTGSPAYDKVRTQPTAVPRVVAIMMEYCRSIVQSVIHDAEGLLLCCTTQTFSWSGSHTQEVRQTAAVPSVARAPPRLWPVQMTRLGFRPPDSSSRALARCRWGRLSSMTDANCCRKPAGTGQSRLSSLARPHIILAAHCYIRGAPARRQQARAAAGRRCSGRMLIPESLLDVAQAFWHPTKHEELSTLCQTMANARNSTPMGMHEACDARVCHSGAVGHLCGP